MPRMNTRTLALAALVGIASSTASLAATIGTITISNATHYGYYGFTSTSAQNTKRTINAPFGGAGTVTGTARVIRVAGTITKVHPEAWLSSIMVQPTGNGIAGYQPSWRFSTQRNFTGTVNVSATIYAPGGFNASQLLTLEMFSLDAEQYVPGVDATSTLTYTFDNAFPAGSAEYTGALTTSDPVFNRPIRYGYTDGLGNPQLYPPELTGAFPYYDVQPFHVDTAGRYDMVTANEFESAAVLYGGGFNPDSPLDYLMAAVNQGHNVVRNRNLNSLPNLDDATGSSTITADLVPGVQYYFVTTAFNAPGIEPDGGPFVGRYQNLITGAGGVTLGLVPEPATLSALVALGAIALRRR